MDGPLPEVGFTAVAPGGGAAAAAAAKAAAAKAAAAAAKAAAKAVLLRCCEGCCQGCYCCQGCCGFQGCCCCGCQGCCQGCCCCWRWRRLLLCCCCCGGGCCGGRGGVGAKRLSFSLVSWRRMCAVAPARIGSRRTATWAVGVGRGPERSRRAARATQPGARELTTMQPSHKTGDRALCAY